MPKEIERKFLVDNLPENIQQAESSDLEQGYLALDPNGNEVRLRRSGEAYELTVKSRGSLARGEYEIPLSAGQFEALWEATAGRRLRKTRYIWKSSGREIEIDVYEHPLKGLVVAEVEFESEEAADRYQKEPWMGKEVTHLNFLKNRHLLDFDNFEALKEKF